MKRGRYARRKRNLLARRVLMVAILGLLAVLVGVTVRYTVKTLERAELKPYDTVSSTVSSTVESEKSGALAVPESSEAQSVSSASKPEVSSAVSESSVSSAQAQTSSLPAAASAAGLSGYQKLYPELYVPQVEKIPARDGDKVVYLTFDDGPSNLTPKVLDILDQYGIKGTFFVVGKTDAASENTMKEIVARGHAIGVHTYTHDFRSIYASPEAYLEDFEKEHQLIYDVTGVNTGIFRFAGGSVNGYDKAVAKTLVAEMTRRGFTYFDWNVSAGDADRGATQASIYSNSVNGILGHEKSIMLCHDAATKSDTVAQLPKIIKAALDAGYRFEKLDPSVKPIVFKIPS